MKDNKSKTEALELYEGMNQRLYSMETMFGGGSPFSELLKSMVTKLLEGEVGHHMENELLIGNKNKRNRYTKKYVITSSDQSEVLTPRDRNSTFDPEWIPKEKECCTAD